ncbi:crotonase/enoyl-CoA hydratase family protein [Skermania sp. ID1734]|uniref:crotonase/enoyl-CoA hydratase family protein n=1 Tax=Skermania sp. ID1734 TaxID=2597516 RepID=UPI00117EFBD0|nr:crotonase/enoyl-CoA hydratase family protein [Skermania sp. ID1734]TSE00276.1 crotonase/enoyl-CoA hydratase family protein [Skermania sp. ID1734]
MSERITLEVVDGIAYATLNRPDKMNSLDFPLIEALASVPAKIAKDKSIRVVILKGAGKAFSTGIDFATFKDTKKTLTSFAKLPTQTTNLFQKCSWQWRELPVPVLAVTHGHCYGGGIQIALAADFRFTTPDCKFAVMEGRWGLIPDMTGSVTLRELLPMDLAKRLTMTAEVFNGVKAKEYGLVTEVSDDPMASAEALAKELIQRSPDALAATKKLFHQTWTESPRSAFWTETVLQARLLTGKNHRIARSAGAKKEPPTWVTRTLD